jgi:hypothetical protein
MSRPLSLFLILLAGAAPLAAQKVLVDRIYDEKTGTRVLVTALTSELPTSGYLPVRVSLRNGGKIDRNWSFRFTSYDTSWADESNETRSDFSGSCPSGEATSFEFLVPLVTAFQQSFSASTELDLSVSATAYPAIEANMSSYYDPEWPSIFMSSSLYKKNASILDAETEAQRGGTSSSGGSGSSVPFAGQFDPKQLSDQWLAYSGYDHCLITDDEWRALSPGARSALLQWNRLGGSLLICSSDPSLQLKGLGIEVDKPGVRESSRSWGMVELLSTPASGELNPTETVELVAKAIPATRGENRLKSLRNDFSSSWPLHFAFGSKTAHIILFILVLIAFGILVGPVNLFVFAKAGRRHRLFVTTPIISIGASLLLIVLIIFQDGFGGRGQRLLLMEVRSDHSENAAFLSQEQIARTGVLFATGFSTTEPAYLSPVLIEDSRWARVTQSNNGGNSRYQTKVLENGLQLAGDWFQSRSEHGHLLEAVRPTRGRIELISPAPDPAVTSTFDFPLESLVLLDNDGGIWQASNVQQGRRTTLAPMPPAEFALWKQQEIDRFSGRNKKRLILTLDRPGHFVATSEEAPGISSLDSISWKDTHAVLTGPLFTP